MKRSSCGAVRRGEGALCGCSRRRDRVCGRGFDEVFG